MTVTDNSISGTNKVPKVQKSRTWKRGKKAIHCTKYTNTLRLIYEINHAPYNINNIKINQLL
jgi:hypothetical protein